MSAARLVRVRPSRSQLDQRGGNDRAETVDDLAQLGLAGGPVRIAVGANHGLVDGPGHFDLHVGVAGEQRGDLRPLPVGQQVSAGGQGPSRGIERVAGPAAASRGVELEPAATFLQTLPSQLHGVEGSIITTTSSLSSSTAAVLNPVNPPSRRHRRWCARTGHVRRARISVPASSGRRSCRAAGPGRCPYGLTLRCRIGSADNGWQLKIPVPACKPGVRMIRRRSSSPGSPPERRSPARDTTVGCTPRRPSIGMAAVHRNCGPTGDARRRDQRRFAKTSCSSRSSSVSSAISNSSAERSSDNSCARCFSSGYSERSVWEARRDRPARWGRCLWAETSRRRWPSRNSPTAGSGPATAQST